jgi:hypothetical protein
MPWNTDKLPLDSVANWGQAGATRFSAFQYASSAETAFVAADATTWSRSVTMIAPDLRYPVIYVHDRFEGGGASDAKVLTWNLMAQGPVGTPAGRYDPVERLNTGQSQQPNALPSNGPVRPLGPGLQRFHFTGQTWLAHATEGIDWDLYLLPEVPQQFYIGNWGHSAHSGREVSEYERVNGSPFHEEQHILRVRGNGSFSTIFLPYRKGEAPDRTVKQDACGIRVAQRDSTLCFSEHSYSFTDSARTVLTTFDNTFVAFAGVSVSGGPTEVIVAGNTATITASGCAGMRSISLEGNWSAPQGIDQSGSTYRFDNCGEEPASFSLRRWPARAESHTR